MNYVGTSAIGGIVGYYVGAQKLLGIQESETRKISPSGGNETDDTQSQATETSEPGGSDSIDETESDGDQNTPSEGGSSNETGFVYTFEDGLQDWTFGKRRDDRGSEGKGSWSDKYDGSMRLHVDGAPETIMAWKEVGPLSAGTTVTANYAPERFEYSAASLFLRAVIPGEGGVVGDRESDEGQNPEQDGTLEIEIPRDLPAETQIEFELVIWPGDTTVWIQDVRSLVDD